MTLMGIVHNYEGLLAARFMLGVPEAGIFPACAYYITIWYTRHEAMYRTALFYATASLALVFSLLSHVRNSYPALLTPYSSGAFSGLLAYAITLMNGVGGLAGWQWIFILEGILTVVAGVIAYFMIHNGPESVSWLTEEEKTYLRVRLMYDGNRTGMGANEEGSKRRPIKNAFCDWQVSYYLAMSSKVNASAQAFELRHRCQGLPQRCHLPGRLCLDLRTCVRTTDHYFNSCKYSILVVRVAQGRRVANRIQSLQGYTNRAAQLMTIPPYVTACILTIAVAHFSDRLKRRGYFIGGSLFVSLIGFVIAIATSGSESLAKATYVGCFLACCGFFPAFPGVISWLSNNLAGPYKRAIAMSLQICRFGPIFLALRCCH